MKIKTNKILTKRNFLLVLAFFVFQMIFILVVKPMIINFYLLSENHFAPLPEIDTIFTPDFTKENFDRINNEMTTEEVVELIGTPFDSEAIKINEVTENGYGGTRQPSDNAECWRYSKDGKLGERADFSWYSYKVCFEDNKVYLKLVEEFFD